jgi:hypothetical protein
MSTFTLSVPSSEEGANDAYELTVSGDIIKKCATLWEMYENCEDSNVIPLQCYFAKNVVETSFEFIARELDGEITVTEGYDGNRIMVTVESEKKLEWVDDMNMCMKIVLFANFVDHKNLLGVSCQCIADKIKGKSVPEMRAAFGLPDDISPAAQEKFNNQPVWGKVPSLTPTDD